MFDKCTVGNPVYMKLVFHFHPYTLQQIELSLNTTCLTELVVKYINGWLRRLIRSEFLPIASLYSFHTVDSVKSQDTVASFTSVAIFLTAVPLAVNQCNCMSTFSFKTLIVVIWCLRVRMYYLAVSFTVNFRHCEDHLCSRPYFGTWIHFVVKYAPHQEVKYKLYI